MLVSGFGDPSHLFYFLNRCLKCGAHRASRKRREAAGLLPEAGAGGGQSRERKTPGNRLGCRGPFNRQAFPRPMPQSLACTPHRSSRQARPRWGRISGFMGTSKTLPTASHTIASFTSYGCHTEHLVKAPPPPHCTRTPFPSRHARAHTPGCVHWGGGGIQLNPEPCELGTPVIASVMRNIQYFQ